MARAEGPGATFTLSTFSLSTLGRSTFNRTIVILPWDRIPAAVVLGILSRKILATPSVEAKRVVSSVF